jgi:hypothetical protein
MVLLYYLNNAIYLFYLLFSPSTRFRFAPLQKEQITSRLDEVIKVRTTLYTLYSTLDIQYI